MGARRVVLNIRQPGFTLVEVLVALVIMAVMAAMGWQGVSGMARAREAAQTAGERSLRLSTLVAQWEQDLAALYDGPNLPGLQFDGAALRITRRAEGGVQVVVWSLREGRWRRWASPVTTRATALQQSWEASAQLQGNEAAQLLLAEGVTDWQVYLWRGGGWSNAQSTGDLSAEVVTPSPAAAASAAVAASGASAPAPTVRSRSQLPNGVRLQIDLPEGRLLRDVALAPHAP